MRMSGSVVIAGWVIIVVFGLLSTLAPSYWELVVLRALVGYGIGISQTTSYDLCCELLPQKHRSKVTYTSILNVFAGVYFLVILWLLLATYGWRIIIFMCALPVGKQLLIYI